MQDQGGESPMSHKAQRHPNYYFEDGNLVLLVEDVLFCIHRYLLRKHSPVFEGMLMLPQSETAGLAIEGSNDLNPIIIPQITSADFANLMWMFYDERFDKDPASSRSAGKWQSILSLSHRWDMTAIKTAALEALSSCSPPLDPIDKLSICSLYQIEKTWAMDAFVALAKRSKRLTIAEGRKIGVDCVVILADVREELAAKPNTFSPHTWPGMNPNQGDPYERLIKAAISRAEKPPGEASPVVVPSHPFMGPGGVQGPHAPWFPPDYSGIGLGLVNQN